MSRTLKLLRDTGWLADVAEHPYNRFSGRRKDLHGFADIHAFNDTMVALVQTTTCSNLSAHRKKIAANPNFGPWLASPFRLIMLVGWKKKKNRWVPMVEMIGTPPDSTGKRTHPA